MTARILVVDDSQVELLLVESLLLKNSDYRVELAENGQNALAKLSRASFDVVVTDLVMPEMNGVELVRRVRRHYPDTPVILMTAYGDETTATEALDAGAASYVPKSRRAERLVETVDRVVERAAAARSRERLEQCLLDYHCRFALPNDLGLLRSLVNHVQRMMAACQFGDAVERIRIGEALEEALLNAMYHGNLEIDEGELARAVEERCRETRLRDRKIIVVARVTDTEVRFVIRDQGRGFSAPFTSTGSESSFDRGSHRGLTLMHSLMDEVAHNDAGNELTLRKCAPAASQPTGATT